YDVGPLPALFGLDPGVVVYLGTTTKILTPALRVGWLVASPELVGRLVEVAAGLGAWAGGPAPQAGLRMVRPRRLERPLLRRARAAGRRWRACPATAPPGGCSATRRACTWFCGRTGTPKTSPARHGSGGWRWPRWRATLPGRSPRTGWCSGTAAPAEARSPVPAGYWLTSPMPACRGKDGSEGDGRGRRARRRRCRQAREGACGQPAHRR